MAAVVRAFNNINDRLDTIEYYITEFIADYEEDEDEEDKEDKEDKEEDKKDEKNKKDIENREEVDDKKNINVKNEEIKEVNTDDELSADTILNNLMNNSSVDNSKKKNTIYENDYYGYIPSDYNVLDNFDSIPKTKEE